MKKKNNNSKLFTIVGGIIIVLVLMGLYWFYNYTPANYIKVNATQTNSVTQLKSFYAPEHLQFVDKSGQSITFSWIQFGFGPSQVEGSTRTVYYNPSNPKQAKAYTSKSTYIITYTVLIVIAIFVAISPKTIKKKPNKS